MTLSKVSTTPATETMRKEGLCEEKCSLLLLLLLSPTQTGVKAATKVLKELNALGLKLLGQFTLYKSTSCLVCIMLNIQG